MAYREVNMTEIKEILLRVGKKESIRSISKKLGIHRDTINKYLNICYRLGVGPREETTTDELSEKIRASLAPGNKPSHIPRDEILLPHKGRIEAYLDKGIKGSKIMILLARDGIKVNESVSPHSIPHSFATHLIESGVDVFKVQKLLGHSSLDTTRIYINFNNSKMSKAIERL
jgi:integrase